MPSFKLEQGDEERAPKVLDGLDAPALARYITSGKCKKITVMLGAVPRQVSQTSDLRPETGLYANLARLNLPYPEAVFEINFFRRNPTPFYTLAQELYPGKFRPTITHSFIKLLATKSLLHTCFTQNIDTLERRAGIPAHKIIEAHGSFAKQRCIRCKIEFDDDMMKEHVLLGKVPKCEACGGYVKSDIVFFGEGLPPEFISAIPRLAEADLLIVLGTSLAVHPFASLPGKVAQGCPRVLINRERVGDFGSRADDVILLGKCDDVVRDLAKGLGWEEELERAWEETAQSVQSDLKPCDDLVEARSSSHTRRASSWRGESMATATMPMVNASSMDYELWALHHQLEVHINRFQMSVRGALQDADEMRALIRDFKNLIMRRKAEKAAAMALSTRTTLGSTSEEWVPQSIL